MPAVIASKRKCSAETSGNVLMDQINFQEDSKYKYYPLKVDQYEPDIFQQVKHKINVRNTANSKFANAKLSEYNQVSFFYVLQP